MASVRPGSLSLRRPLAALVLVAGLLAPAPADAAIVQLKNGEQVDAERYYPTVTAMVVIARNFEPVEAMTRKQSELDRDAVALSAYRLLRLSTMIDEA